ncbi:MAG: hypothetical protein WCC66_14285 [Rhizobiaceae bacterium]
MNRALAAAVILTGLSLTGNAFAGSIIALGGDQASISSIIKLGEPDPCASNACGAEEVTAADPESATAAGSALVDQNGMPTNMPVVMRPSMDTAPVDAPAAAAPVADPAAVTPQTPEPEPVKMEPAPQPVQVEGQPVEQQNQPVKEG